MLISEYAVLLIIITVNVLCKIIAKSWGGGGGGGGGEGSLGGGL